MLYARQLSLAFLSLSKVASVIVYFCAHFALSTDFTITFGRFFEGGSRQAANATQSYAIMWQNGSDIRQVVNRSQYFEHKSRLKQIGLDIGQPFDVTRMCPTLRRSEIIEVNPLPIPNWYHMPVASNSNVMPFKAIA